MATQHARAESPATARDTRRNSTWRLVIFNFLLTCGANAGITGACCFHDGTCTDTFDEFDCNDASGTYLGDGIECGAIVCPDERIGACCKGNVCVLLAESTCTTFDGAFQGPETTCADVTCDQTCPCDITGTSAVPGKPNGQVEIFDLLAFLSIWFAQDADADITAPDGVDVNDLLSFLSCWFAGQVGECPAPTGACCTSSFDCQTVTEAMCNALGGAYARDNSDCELLPTYSTTPPPLVRLYSTMVPIVDATYVTALANNLFTLTGTIDANAMRVRIANGNRGLSVYVASGTISYSDDDKLWNASYPGTAMTESDAVAMANDFLDTNNLLPDEAFVTSAELRSTKDAPSGTALVNHWNVTYALQLDALQGISPTPMFVPVHDAEITVQIGDNEVIGLYWHWRPVTPGGTTPTFNRDTALMIASEEPGFEPACPFSVALEYKLEPEAFPQAVLAPYYLAASYLNTAHPMPASTFAPQARIIGPDSDDIFATCAVVNLEADIQGGTPPYSVVWIDPQEFDARVRIFGATNPGASAVLGITNPLATPLNGGTHNIDVIVTDANGLRTRDRRVVRVEEGTCAETQQSCGTPTIITTNESVDDCHGWSLNAEITGDDGLALRHIRFRNNTLAFDTRLPYYAVVTDGLPRGEKSELYHPPAPNGRGNLFSTLLDPGINVICNEHYFAVTASYWISGMPTGFDSQMIITQDTVFFPKTRGCAPFDPKSCVRYWPHVSWFYLQLADLNNFYQLDTYQRFDFDAQGSENRCAYYQDPDGFINSSARFAYRTVVRIPAPSEEGYATMARFGDPGAEDNHHVRAQGGKVAFPGCTRSGSWRCAHQHWRWSNLFYRRKWGYGEPLVPNWQRVTAWTVRYHANEEDPPSLNLANLINPSESIGDTERDVVMWEHTSSTAERDTTSSNHWFFR